MIISYLIPNNCVQINNYKIEIIAWNYIIVSIR